MVAENLSRDDALDLVHCLLEYYPENANPKERTAWFLERAGLDRLKSELLTLLPYIPLEDVRLPGKTHLFSPRPCPATELKYMTPGL